MGPTFYMRHLCNVFKKLVEWLTQTNAFCSSDDLERARDHITDCYFGITDISGFSAKNKKIYPNLATAMRPVNHTDSLEIPKLQHISHDVFLPADQIISLESDEEIIPPALKISESILPHLINQCELNDLVRDRSEPKNRVNYLVPD